MTTLFVIPRQHAPSPELLDTITYGDYVQVIAQKEPLWVRVATHIGDTITGAIFSTPQLTDLHNLHMGDVLTFPVNTVLSIIDADVEL